MLAVQYMFPGHTVATPITAYPLSPFVVRNSTCV
ncbi:hypothetical protein [Sulfolobus super-elliptical virus]|nr:hypothetical protein [Sulfolobus super-elliptical virus]